MRDLSPAAALAVAHVGETEGIDGARLEVRAEALIPRSLTGGDLTRVALADPSTAAKYIVYLDADGQVVDGESLLSEEQSAHEAKYGKLEPALYQALSAAELDTVQVGVWMRDIDHRAVEDAVAAEDPEARFQDGRPSPSLDRETSDGVWREVMAASAKAYEVLQGDLADGVSAAGGNVLAASAVAPLVYAEVPRSFVGQLAARDDVLALYLMRTYEPAQGSAYLAERGDVVRGLGLDGSGQSVGVIEQYGVYFGNPYLNDGRYYSPVSQHLADHPTQVAGCIASTDAAQHPGLAPGALVLSGNPGSGAEAELMKATEWAIGARANLANEWLDPGEDAWVLNHSYQLQTQGAFTANARFLDHIALHYGRTSVVASGNYPNEIVTSPALAYNVIAVGAFDDANTAPWGDDAMWGESSWMDPGLRTKPEVAAVGANVQSTAYLSTWRSDSGTSFAAPQVSGEIALLMERNWYLMDSPELVKAIVMASAVNSIEGDGRVSDRDGVGGVDASLADLIVRNGQFIEEVITDSFVGGYVHRSFQAASGARTLLRGERVRVVLTWGSHPDWQYQTDPLLANLDLVIKKADGTVLGVAGSQSDDDYRNFEIVDFVVPQTGTYQIGIRREAFAGAQERIALAWIVQSPSVPLVAKRIAMGPVGDTWGTGLQIANLGSGEAHVTMQFYWAAGTCCEGQLAHTLLVPAMAPGGSAPYYLPDEGFLPDGFLGSAVAYADQPVTANANVEALGVALQRKGAVRSSSPATVMYWPQVHKHQWGVSTYLAVQNASDDLAWVTARYYTESTGAEIPAAAQVFSLAPFATKVLYQADNGNLPDFWGGSARVSSNKPITGAGVIYFEEAPNILHATAAGAGASTVYVPRLVRSYGESGDPQSVYGFQGGLSVQNIGTSATNLTIAYTFGLPGYYFQTFVQTVANVAPNAAVHIFLRDVPVLDPLDGKNGSPPWPWQYRTGSAVVTSSNGQSLVATSNEDYRGANPQHVGKAATYLAFPAYIAGVPAGESSVVFPQITKDYYGYSGGVQVQNVGGSTTTATAAFGQPPRTVAAQLAPGQSVSWYAPDVPGLPSNWSGAVTVSVSNPAQDRIVGIGNNSLRLDVTESQGDSYVNYEGPGY